MKRLIGIIVIPLLLGGCSTLGIGKPDQVTRWLASIGCVVAVTNAIGEITGDPSVGGAKTVTDVIGVINRVGTSNIPATVLAACKDDITHVGEDAAAVATLLQNSTGTDQPKATPPKMAARPPAQPKAPQPVVVPVPKKS